MILRTRLICGIIVNCRAVHVPVEHRSSEEPGRDPTGKFVPRGREREGQNLCFAEAMLTFLIVLLGVMNISLIVFSRSNFSFNCVVQVTGSSNLGVTSAGQHQPCPAYEAHNGNKNKLLSLIYWFSYLGVSEFFSSL